MIPILYDSTEVSFTSNGLGRLADCISCTVTEERNGIYECQFQYPITGEMYPLIQEGCILGVIHDDVKDIQPFDIYGRSAPLNGVVTFYAHHISYRLGNIILKPMTAASCAAALDAIPNKTYTECPFTFWTDKSVSATWKNEVPNPVKAILGGQQGSILDVYGKGEYEFDKWTVKLYVNRGVDNGVSIRYGVNLTDLQHDIDISGAYTAVVPFWKSAEGDTVVTLTEGYVQISVPQLVAWTDNNGEEINDDQGRTIYFNAESSGTLLRTTVIDLSDAFDEQPTQAQLRAEAMRRLSNSEAWLPSENIKVSFVDLAHTEEYKAVAALQRVRLCDRVSVYCGPLGVSAVSMQVIRVVFNVLTERYDEIELGKAKTSLAQTITATLEEATKDLPSMSMMHSAINNVTEQITGAKGGHILDIFDTNGKRQEMLIMDTEDVNTAVKVWRMNLGGFGFSRNGYAGPYGLAITQNGEIVADFITAGTLIANIIKAGILSDESGLNYWNMETGEFSLASTATVGGSTVNQIAEGAVNAQTQQSIFNKLTNNGQTQGIYLKNGLLYVNAEYIDAGVLNGDLISVKLLRVIDDYNHVIATFDDTITIGSSNNTRVSIDNNSFSIIDYMDREILMLGDLRNADGTANVEDVYISDGTKTLFTTYSTIRTITRVLVRNMATTDYTKISSNAIQFTNAPAAGSEIRIQYVTADIRTVYTIGQRASDYGEGNYSTSLGYENIAVGAYCVAEGHSTKAFGGSSHSEGYATIASGHGSHAEGGLPINYQIQDHNGPTASGRCSHAEGECTVASGEASHAEGRETIASGDNQHVFGRWNVSGSGAEIVGGGSISRRENIRTLDWSGNEWIAGTLTQASDARLKDESGEVPDVSSIRARRFRWNDKKISHDDKDHIGYFAQDVEKIAPYLVDEDANGYKSLDYIALLCAKVEALERKVAELEKGVR